MNIVVMPKWELSNLDINFSLSVDDIGDECTFRRLDSKMLHVSLCGELNVFFDSARSSLPSIVADMRRAAPILEHLICAMIEGIAYKCVWTNGFG